MSQKDLATLKNLELLLEKARQRSPKSDRIDDLLLSINLIKGNYNAN
jgi:hypothetical protein